tara:strand:+ start:378 stop:641 length:264 start_codon:yes stop_codon:yes gene_type:complete
VSVFHVVSYNAVGAKAKRVKKIKNNKAAKNDCSGVSCSIMLAPGSIDVIVFSPRGRGFDISKISTLMGSDQILSGCSIVTGYLIQIV